MAPYYCISHKQNKQTPLYRLYHLYVDEIHSHIK